MKVVICKDNDVDIDLIRIIDELNSIVNYISFSKGDIYLCNNKYDLNNNINHNEQLIVRATNQKLVENDFYLFRDNNVKAIISLYKMDILTKYSMNTYFLYFLAEVLLSYFAKDSFQTTLPESNNIRGFSFDKLIEKSHLDDNSKYSLRKENLQVIKDVELIYDEIRNSSSFLNIIDYWKKQKVSVFVSYSHEDKEYLNEFKKYIKVFEQNELISRWDDNELIAGEKWDETIKDKMAASDIVLFLISASSLVSEYIQKYELQEAVKLNENSEVFIIPVIIKDCLWDMTKFSEFQVLPDGGKAVNSWERKEEAWTNVARGVHKAILKMISSKRAISENSQNVDVTEEYDSNTKLILKFLRSNPKKWMNIIKMKNWGSEFDEFRDLKLIQRSEFKTILQTLIADSKVESKRSRKYKNSFLYKLRD